ncbi:hypothetical protein IWW38_003531 [Coemansia aciculifera]|uniref:Uncharacterized protein n=1 Tax=Coemansia aciculifera TaxID=417176 RepID=A0ACC1M1Y1_9FUNG|nr:hypothetical protein IWW38_003531 [Coemansia aciculifera]
MYSTSSTSIARASKFAQYSSEDGIADSGELWISPKVSRTSTMRTETGSSRPGSVRQARSTVPAGNSRGGERQTLREESTSYSRRKAHARKSGTLAEEPPLELRLSVVQIVAWYVPRILLLFFIGWSWSVGVQLIHAQQNTLDTAPSTTSSVGGAALLSPVGSVPDYQSLHSIAAAAVDSGDDDINESDESDVDFQYEGLLGLRINGGTGRRRNGAAPGPSEFTRDLISRALGHASWSNAISGLMTVLVGMAYPFLDSKWQSYPSHRIGWNEVLRCVGGFLGVNYAALKLPFESAAQSAAIMIIISLGLWTVCDGTLHGLLLSTSMSLMATWLLYVHALSNYYSSFSQDDYLGLLSYLPSVLFTYCVMAGSIGRRLGYHPLWRRRRQ